MLSDVRPVTISISQLTDIDCSQRELSFVSECSCFAYYFAWTAANHKTEAHNTKAATKMGVSNDYDTEPLDADGEDSDNGITDEQYQWLQE